MSQKRIRKKKPSHAQTVSTARRDEGARFLVSAICLAALLGGAAYGLERLKGYVYGLPEYNPPVRVELAELAQDEWVEREGWLPRILNGVVVPQDKEWMGRELLENVADQVERSGWVSGVRRVWKETDGTIRLACDYRRPVAMVQTRRGKFIPVDAEGVRLPEEYDRVAPELGWMRIIGVESAMPDVGERFDESAGDALAGIRLAALIFQRPGICSRISGVDVTNFNGRRNKRDNHIRLWTRDHREIVWGSAIGQEIEEPTTEEKLRGIEEFLLRKGASQVRADVSIYPRAVLIRMDESSEPNE